MRKEEIEARNTYNKIAGAYHFFRTKKYPDGWFYNEMLEMPAVFDLLGNVNGKKILDFGCGTGIYAKALKKKGAIVKGFDISEVMITIARKENPEIEFKVGSGYNIPFKEKFDIVLAGLVFDYFRDWDKVFKQINKVLNKNGILVFSTGNPVSECCKKVIVKKKKLKVLGKRGYFEESKRYAHWNRDEDKEVIKNMDIKIPDYHKTYETIFNTILRNGFEITGYKDAFPLKKAKKLFPKHYAICSKIPYFCVWRVKKK